MRLILIIGAVIAVAGGSFFAVKTLQTKNSQPQSSSVISNKEPMITPRQKSSIQNMPLPRDAGVIAQFFKNIEDRKIEEAIALMGSNITGDDKVKQAWGVQLNAMKSVKVAFIELHMYPQWKQTEHRYKVTVDISMDPTSAEAPIPYYGWENGKNIRWITLVRENSDWKITEIATGP